MRGELKKGRDRRGKRGIERKVTPLRKPVVLALCTALVGLGKIVVLTLDGGSTIGCTRNSDETASHWTVGRM